MVELSLSFQYVGGAEGLTYVSAPFAVADANMQNTEIRVRVRPY